MKHLYFGGDILTMEHEGCQQALLAEDGKILGAGPEAEIRKMADGAREVFLDGLDEGTRLRAMGWALWKALITYDDADPAFRDNARLTVQAILDDKKYAGR